MTPLPACYFLRYLEGTLGYLFYRVVVTTQETGNEPVNRSASIGNAVLPGHVTGSVYFRGR